MDGIQMEPLGKYKADRNGSAKAAWRNMVDQEMDDVAFLADSEKAREAMDLQAPVAVCSQRRAVCIVVLILITIFVTALLVVYASPQPDCPCLVDPLFPGLSPTEDSAAAAANKERIATNGVVFPWRGFRLPTSVLPRHYNLWLHPNLTTGELRGEVSIDLKVDRDTTFVVLNVRDMNVTERALFKSGGIVGPKIIRVLDYPQAEQTYIEFKEKLRRKYNYTLSLRFITKLERNDKQMGFFVTGSSKHRCAVSRFWLTHARSTFPCFDEPNFRSSFKLTIVRDRFHVSLTNMPIVATEEAGFYLGHRLLQDEFADSPPMSPHMMSITVCRMTRRNLPPLVVENPVSEKPVSEKPVLEEKSNVVEEEDININVDMAPPEISLYSDQISILNDTGPLLQWIQKTIQQFAYELNTSYPLPKFDVVVIEGSTPYSEGWGLIILSPSTLSDTKLIARLLAQQWFGGLLSPRWWNSQWLMDALTSVLAERAPSIDDNHPNIKDSALLLDHVLPALRLDASNSVRAVASPRLEIADIESVTDELSLHKGAAIVMMALDTSDSTSGRSALSRLLHSHGGASAEANEFWRLLRAQPHNWAIWCDTPGYPLIVAQNNGTRVRLTQERFLMAAKPPSPDPPILNDLLTLDLRTTLEELFIEPENFTIITDEEELNLTTTTPVPTTTKKPSKSQKSSTKWVIPITFMVGPLKTEYQGEGAKVYNASEHDQNGAWYDIGNETSKGSRWAVNVTHLVWMNDTELIIPDLNKHKWVRYNIGARGLYRVAPQSVQGETPEEAQSRASVQYLGANPAERALLLDDVFVLSRASRLPNTRAIAASVRLKNERNWAPWRVVLTHLSWWKELLRDSAAGPGLMKLLSTLHPPNSDIYTKSKRTGDDDVWLSGALLTAGVEWENVVVTKKALQLFDGWMNKNETIPDIYQEAAFTAGVRAYGDRAWEFCWRALTASYSAARPLYEHRALITALTAAKDDWLFYRFVYTALSVEAQRGREWNLWATTVCAAACRWRGSSGVWQVLNANTTLPLESLNAAARCLRQPRDYYRFKELFGKVRGVQSALDTISLNVAWSRKAEIDLYRYFNAVQ